MILSVSRRTDIPDYYSALLICIPKHNETQKN